MDTLEVTVKTRIPDHYIVQGGFDLYIPGLGQTRISPFKVFMRSAIVIITTLIVGLCLPISIRQKSNRQRLLLKVQMEGFMMKILRQRLLGYSQCSESSL